MRPPTPPEENSDDEWRLYSDGLGELMLFCPECAEREFGGSVPVLARLSVPEPFQERSRTASPARRNETAQPRRFRDRWARTRSAGSTSQAEGRGFEPHRPL
jgi:hypothetical protein